MNVVSSPEIPPPMQNGQGAQITARVPARTGGAILNTLHPSWAWAWARRQGEGGSCAYFIKLCGGLAEPFILGVSLPAPANTP